MFAEEILSFHATFETRFCECEDRNKVYFNWLPSGFKASQIMLELFKILRRLKNNF